MVKEADVLFVANLPIKLGGVDLLVSAARHRADVGHKTSNTVVVVGLAGVVTAGMLTGRQRTGLAIKRVVGLGLGGTEVAGSQAALGRGHTSRKIARRRGQRI